MRILGIEITASRWPWQEGYTWKGTKTLAPLFNTARFGGGWKYKLGIDMGGSTLLLNLLFGSIRIRRVIK